MKLENLINALEFLIEEKNLLNNDDGYSFTEYDELTNIIEELLHTVYQLIPISEIEIKITHEMDIDTKSLKQVLQIFTDKTPKTFNLKSGDRIVTINSDQIINEFNDFIEKIELGEMDRLNALFALESFYDIKLDELLAGFKENSRIFSFIKSILKNKLKNLNQDEILLLWARMRSYFSNDEQTRGFPIYKDIIPNDFFDVSDSSIDIYEKCALLIAKYRPLTIKNMVENGITLIPTLPPGIARVLAISDTSGLLPITNLEILLIRSLSQILTLYQLITKKNYSDIAKTIGADSAGIIFKGGLVKAYRDNINHNRTNNINKCKILILNVKRLIEYLTQYGIKNSLIEEALLQYKRGQEVIHPVRLKEFGKNNRTLELYLQKDISKFLLERSILAFGKSIGRNQIDIYHKDTGGEDFIIEVKIYKHRKKKITLKELNNNIVQLMSYMDLHNQPRGILTIYNLTNRLIITPRKWIKGRILIMCINLCSLSASQRQASTEIIESKSESRMIDIREIN